MTLKLPQLNHCLIASKTYVIFGNFHSILVAVVVSRFLLKRQSFTHCLCRCQRELAVAHLVSPISINKPYKTKYGRWDQNQIQSYFEFYKYLFNLFTKEPIELK